MVPLFRVITKTRERVMKTSFKDKYGKWAVITGGTSGIGWELADQIAAQGLNIVLVARRANLLESKSRELTQKHRVTVKTIQADLSNLNEISKVIEGTIDLEVGLIIPCAAIETHGLSTKIDIEKEEALINLNVVTTFKLTHHFTQRMVERGRGGVILVSSMIGHMPNSYFSNYAASKAYVLNYGRSLNGELKEKGVDVTVVSPGATETPMIDNAGIDMDKTGFTVMQPDVVARVALDALGKKPSVIPGKKNNIMVFMATRIMSTKMAINMGAKMMRDVLDSSVL